MNSYENGIKLGLQYSKIFETFCSFVLASDILFVRVEHTNHYTTETSSASYLIDTHFFVIVFLKQSLLYSLIGLQLGM